MTTEREKEPAYRSRLKATRADELYVQILQKIVVEKNYKNPGYTATRLAKELNTNSRYISAVVAQRMECNFNDFVNSYRLRDACKTLRSPRYAELTAEEIGLMSGFSSRQAFYLAFRKVYDVTPQQYRTQEPE